MRELHVVALSEDGRSVLLATSPDARRGGFRVALDARLTAAVRGDLPRPGEDEVRDSTLSPKEIQARLRAGETSEQIARMAGVPVARVERFSGPVESERIRIIDGAQAAFLARGRRGASVLPLGEAVDRSLRAMPTLRPETVDWTARREQDGDWLVELRYVARARARVARWRFSPATRQVAALDAASAALGHIDHAARLTREATPAPGRALPRARAKAAAKPVGRPAKAAAKPVGRPAKAAVKPVGRPAKAAAKPVGRPAKAAAKPVGRPAKAAAKPVGRPAKAAAKPVGRPAKAAAKPVGRPAKAAAKPVGRPAKAAAKPVGRPAKAAARAGAPSAAPRRALRVVPSPARRTSVPSAPERAAAGRGASGRSHARVPAWADVLLSTAPRPGPGQDG